MAKDMILGVVDNYNWDQIKYWANSIERSGFEGYKALIVYNMDAPTAQTLTEKGFMLIGVTPYDEHNGFVFNGNVNIMVNRFLHIHEFLRMLDTPMEIDRVIITDVRDVVFQKNPTEWLNDHFSPSFTLLFGSENLTYENEPWGKNNITKSFGDYFYERKKDDTIFCAGVIAGDLDAIKDFSLNLWLVCLGLNPNVEGGGGPDQAAMNILMDLDPYFYSTMRVGPGDHWVLHSGTSLPAIKAGSGGIGEAYMRNPDMKIDFIEDLSYSVDDDMVYVDEKTVTILHQWDRVPEWKNIIEKRYGDN